MCIEIDNHTSDAYTEARSVYDGQRLQQSLLAGFQASFSRPSIFKAASGCIGRSLTSHAISSLSRARLVW